MTSEKEHGASRGPNGPIKQHVIVLAAVLSGYTTAGDVARVCGITLGTASRRLFDLEAGGEIERAEIMPRRGAGTRGGGGAIRWRIKMRT